MIKVPKSRKKYLNESLDILQTEVGSKIYLLLLFEGPLSLNKLSLILYGNRNVKSQIISILQSLNDSNYVNGEDTSKKSDDLRPFEKNPRGRPEKLYYVNNLNPLFYWWNSVFKTAKENVLKSIEKNIAIAEQRSKKPISETIESIKIEVANDKKSLEESLNFIQNITKFNKTETDIMESIFFNKDVFEELKKNFEIYILPYLRNSEINALKILTYLFSIVLYRMIVISSMNALKNVNILKTKDEIGKQKLLTDKEKLDIEKGVKNFMSRQQFAPLDFIILKNFHNSVIDIRSLMEKLSIICSYKYSAEEISKRLYGFWSLS